MLLLASVLSSSIAIYSHVCLPPTRWGLQVLVLTSTRITDRGLLHLAGLSRLQELYLSNTQITDAGLAHFEQLSELRKLLIDGTRVTKSGVAELQKALPDCIIVH